MYSVYILTVSDGRKYIGATSMPVKSRWNNGNGYRFCGDLWDIICSDGWSAIEKEVVASNLTEAEASALEQQLIREYKTTVPGFGFNSEEGGVGCYKIISEKSRQKMRESHRGEKHFNYGKHFSEEHKEKIAESNRGQKRSEETRLNISLSKRKAVNQYTRSGAFLATYESGKIAAAITGVPAYAISKVCRGNRSLAGGYIWKFSE